MTFKLRRLEKSDAQELVLIANNIKIAQNLTNQFPHPYTQEAAEAFIAFATTHIPAHIKAIDINDKIGGAIGIHPQTDVMCKNAEIGFWLGEQYWGQGIMTQAVKQMTAYGFDTFDITRIYGRAYDRNIGSQKVLEKAGFTLEARFSKTIFKFGEFLDELVYAIRK